MSDKVFINDLIVEIFAGIYEHEKVAKQRVIINITLNVKSNENNNMVSINDVVSYEDIVNKVINISNSRHYDLLEELAEKIARFCLSQDKVNEVTIRLEKPDIIANTKSVGVEITRSALRV